MSERRGLSVRWRTFSLKLKNEGVEIPEVYRVMGEANHRVLRVIEAVRKGEGEHAVVAVYTEAGRRIHHDGERPLADIAGMVAACGLDPSYAEAADDELWDDVIRASMKEALALAGDDVGSPILALQYDGGARVGFFGPIVSPPPTGDSALRLWDGITAAASVDGFYELKRSRTGGPVAGPRP